MRRWRILTIPNTQTAPTAKNDLISHQINPVEQKQQMSKFPNNHLLRFHYKYALNLFNISLISKEYNLGIGVFLLNKEQLKSQVYEFVHVVIH